MDYNYEDILQKLDNLNISLELTPITSLLITTPLSRNITIEMWNTIVEYIIKFIQTFKSLYAICTIMNEFLEYVEQYILDYNALRNKPSIDGVELKGSMSSSDFKGFAPADILSSITVDESSETLLIGYVKED